MRDLLRRTFGRFLIVLAPQYGTCKRCHIPWKFVTAQGEFNHGSYSRGRITYCRPCYLRLHPDTELNEHGVTADGRYSWEIS